MTIFNFESVWTVEAQIDYDLGFRLRVPFACVSNPLYIQKKKKKIINGLYAIYCRLIMHGLIRA